ncbi:hypothetical protein HK102_013310 [Quaeritorhiza haematococci]|nr:hypothetical protein HK102_013310 [Quaeritorhiza haematococci]
MPGKKLSALTTVTNGTTNAWDIVCSECGCKILKKGAAQRGSDCDPTQKLEVHFPPYITKQTPTSDLPTSADQVPIPPFFWEIANMMDFENIGFTKPVSQQGQSAAAPTAGGSPPEHIRYLSCADCDIGPLGYQKGAGARLLLAADRVEYLEV